MAQPNADKLLGIPVGATVIEQLTKEQKRQARSAPNKIAQTAGADADPVLVGLLSDGTDIVGYLPFDAP